MTGTTDGRDAGRAGRRHTARTKAWTLDMIREGATVVDVAHRLALPATTVGNWARADGRRVRPTLGDGDRGRFRAALAEGLSVPQAAARAGIGVTTAYRWARADKSAAVAPMAVRTLPVASWPRELRAVAPALCREERLALGRLCATLATDIAPAFDDVAAFLHRRESDLSTPVYARERRNLLAGLAKALPDIAWTDLPESADARPAPRRAGGRPRTVSIAVEAWPADKRAAWDAARDPGYAAPGDAIPFDPGPLAQRAPNTLAAIEKAYGLYLHARQRRGKSAEITPVGVQVFIDDCRARGNRPRSIAKYIQDLYAIAPVVQPGSGLDWLRRTRNALLRQAHHAPKRKWAEAPVDPAALWAIGCELVERAERQPRDRRRNAARFRNGLVFMLLSSAPVRLENLTAIRIGVHLVLPADTPGELAFARTKAGHGSRHIIWPELRAVIDRYLAVYRPVLAAGADIDYLWLGLNGGRPLTAAAIARRIDRITRARLGRPVNPHAFRDAVATAILLERPDCAEAASALLQHRSPDSIAEYTEQGRTVGAARVLAAASVATRARAARESRSR